MPAEKVPDIVVGRLPIYLRALVRMLQDGQEITSSHELGQRLRISSAQIRKDLSYFGRFGKQGRGYSVARLTEELRSILGLDTRWQVAVIGIGRLGRAIASYPGFEGQGFDIVAMYDANPKLVNTDIDGRIVRNVNQLEADLRKQPVDIGIVAVPAEVAQDVVDTLVHAGVHAILNYTPLRVQVPDGVELRHINPVLFLQSMTYHLKRVKGDR